MQTMARAARQRRSLTNTFRRFVRQQTLDTAAFLAAAEEQDRAAERIDREAFLKEVGFELVMSVERDCCNVAEVVYGLTADLKAGRAWSRPWEMAFNIWLKS